MNAGLVVVGGGPAGFAAASAYRDAGGTGPVRILTADDHPPYNRPPLTKDYLRGESELDELPLQDRSFYLDRDIDIALSSRVVSLDLQRHTVGLASGRSVDYGVLVLATGSEPAALDVPGGDGASVFRLRFLNQGQNLRSAAEAAARAVVIGSGFIGCEAAASLAARGLEVTMVSTEELPQQRRLGRRAAERIAGWLRDDGVGLVGGAEVTSIGGGPEVVCADGGRYVGDLVLMALGIDPQSQLAVEAGLETREGRVVVDEHMRTSNPDVFAAGDVAFARNGLAGRHLVVEHWGEATTMGEVAGACAAGGSAAWAQAPGFWSDIGGRILKYSSWGDGYDEARFVDIGSGAFTVWYGKEGTTVGVLTHEADSDYERGMEHIEAGDPLP